MKRYRAVVDLDDEEFAYIKEQARVSGRSRSWIVRRLIRFAMQHRIKFEVMLRTPLGDSSDNDDT